LELVRQSYRAGAAASELTEGRFNPSKYAIRAGEKSLVRVNVTKVRSVHVSFTNVMPGVLKKDPAEVEGISRGERPHDKRVF
jgi:hypothetical protein